MYNDLHNVKQNTLTLVMGSMLENFDMSRQTKISDEQKELIYEIIKKVWK